MIKRVITLCLAGAACTALSATTALGQFAPITHPTVLIEEFTAEWCGPCVGGYYAMERAKDRWGTEISELTLSVSDNYENPDSRKRDIECGVYAIPTFLFHGTYFSVGTPSDSSIDSYIASCQAQTPKGRIIGRWVPQEGAGLVHVGIKFQADEALGDGYELRIALHENNWAVYCSNGLPGYNYHLQQVFYEDLGGPMTAGQQVTIVGHYDVSANTWIHDWSQLGITVYLHDRIGSSQRNVGGAWEIGEATLGDMNGDLSINLKDKDLYIKAIGSKWYQQGYNVAGDWDYDGDIDSADTALFRAYIDNGGMR